MREKRKYARLTDEQVREVVRAWHTHEATQGELALRYGVSRRQVNTLCHGGSRREIYAAVAADLGDAP